MTKFASIDLFAGIGGIRLGFERAFGKDIETVFVSEWDEWAARTYRENFGEMPPVEGDITKIAAESIPEFDICLAGFPCQAFSFAGHHKGFDDDYKGQSRGTLFAEVVRICDYRKPKVIFCENVKGLVRHDKGRTFKVICGAFEEIGYKVFTQVLNSKNFGVPQNRERIYIVCFRNDIAPEKFEFPSHAGRKRVIRDILDEAPIPAKYYLSTRYLEVLRAHKARHEAEGNLIVDRREHSMVPTTNIQGGINEEDVRKMTPREWARLQGFPEDFVLTEADTHLYKQFGNSVSVPVIAAIAKRIKRVLDEAEQG